jgi:hypothetical protein
MGSEGIVTVDGMEAAPLALATVSPDRRLILLRKLLEVATTVYMTDQQIDDPTHEEDTRDAGTQRQRDAA